MRHGIRGFIVWLAGLVLSISVGVLNTPVLAASETIATFADPASDSSTPLVTFTAPSGGGLDNSTLDIGWNMAGLTLDILGVEHTDVTFSMNTLLIATGISDVLGLEFNASGISGDKTPLLTLEFFSDTNSLLLITFGSAHLSGGNAFASDIFLDDVTITVDGSSQVFTDESFSFAFANQVGENPVFQTLFGQNIAANQETTWTASFSSSATIVPMPAGVWLGMSVLGGLAIIGRIRNKRSKIGAI